MPMISVLFLFWNRLSTNPKALQKFLSGFQEAGSTMLKIYYDSEMTELQFMPQVRISA